MHKLIGRKVKVIETHRCDGKDFYMGSTGVIVNTDPGDPQPLEIHWSRACPSMGGRCWWHYQDRVACLRYLNNREVKV